MYGTIGEPFPDKEICRLLHDAISDAILIMSVSCEQVLAANPAARLIFAKTESEICSVGLNGLLYNSEPKISALADNGQANDTGNVIRFKRSDGSSFEGELTSMVLQLGDGSPGPSIGSTGRSGPGI